MEEGGQASEVGARDLSEGLSDFGAKAIQSAATIWLKYCWSRPQCRGVNENINKTIISSGGPPDPQEGAI
jgi:hypothetical protein